MHTKLALTAALVLPVAMAACNRAPEPEPVAAPVAVGPEAACLEAAAAAGLDTAGATAVPASSTKTGATLYTVSAAGADYTCVVEIDGTVSSFGA